MRQLQTIPLRSAMRIALPSDSELVPGTKVPGYVRPPSGREEPSSLPVPGTKVLGYVRPPSGREIRLPRRADVNLCGKEDRATTTVETMPRHSVVAWTPDHADTNYADRTPLWHDLPTMPLSRPQVSSSDLEGSLSGCNRSWHWPEQKRPSVVAVRPEQRGDLRSLR